MKSNPFSLDFGAQPNLYIPRIDEQNKIISTFMAEKPSSHIFLILGARGSGKTVLMTAVSRRIKEEEKWLHVDLNVESDMLNTLAASIERYTKGKFPKIKFEVSVKGVSLSMEKNNTYSDIQVDLDSMLSTLKKHNINVLITIDEVVNSQNVREFTTYFQHCIREELPVFVLMTGLYKNVRALQNNKSQTFLKRAPKITIGPLSNRRIAKQYEEVFGLSEEESFALAAQTNGYSYGFQILGYSLFEQNKSNMDDKVLFEYQTNLEECSYEKIWEELSPSERDVVKAIAEEEDNVQVKDVREKLGFDSNNFSTYQTTLENSGILDNTAAYGRLKFALPYFKAFAKRR
jgi:energy-coupling factor transporter ATP-binding protein EcfA2